jgi:hypothetical protein
MMCTSEVNSCIFNIPRSSLTVFLQLL